MIRRVCILSAALLLSSFALSGCGPTPTVDAPADRPAVPEAPAGSVIVTGALDVTATPEPPDGYFSQPVTAKGEGDETTDAFDLQKRATFVTFKCGDGDHIDVYLVDTKTHKETTVADGDGSEGSRLIFAKAGEYKLKVRSDGSWVVRVTQPWIDDVPEADYWSGEGLQATEPFLIKAGQRTFRYSNKDADGEFVVKIYGTVDQTIAKKSGNVSGSKTVTVLNDGTAVIQVQSDGKWAIRCE